MKFVWIALGVVAFVLLVKAIDGQKQGKQGKKPKVNDTPSHGDPEPPKQPEKVWKPAEVAFEENLSVLSPLLRGVSKNAISNKDAWTSVIISINNEDLTEMWEASINRPDLWVTYLQTFRLQIDLVESFVGVKEYQEMYDTEDGSIISPEMHYNVVYNCWIYTDENNNKSVALKGVVKVKQNTL